MKNYSGKTINQYYLAKDLGQGGMVVVYKAFDNALNRDVVVKMIRTEDLDGAKQTDILQRFKLLANTLLRLDHPNIAPVLDYGLFEDVPYLVAEYLPGGTLKQRMHKRLSLSAAVQVLVPIADALIYAHSNGVLHQDFKPSNVLFHNQDKRPILADLGIASLFNESVFDPDFLELGFGTPAYMAPEQWRGFATDQSDVYSVGIVFYEMLTGKIANKTETPLAAAFKQSEGLIPDPTEMITGLSADVQHFFFKCLALEPANRFQNMQEMKVAMESLVGLPGMQPPSETGGRRVQASEPAVENPSRFTRPGYEATLIKSSQEEPVRQETPQPSNVPSKTVSPTLASPLPIQDDFRPRLRPDSIRPKVASQPAKGPLPPIQLQQKPSKSKPGLEATAPRQQGEPARVFKNDPWVAALILGLALGIANLIKVAIFDIANFSERAWISSLIGSTIGWLIAGLAIYFYYRLTTRLKLCAIGLVGFALAGIIPTLLEQIVPLPSGTWLATVVMWLFLAIGVGMMFHGPNKLQSSEGLALIGGWTIAGVLSVLPLIVFSLIDAANGDVPLTLRLIQGLLLGAVLAASVHISFEVHFKYARHGFAKLIVSFSVAGILAYLLFYGVQNKNLASGISWLVMTTLSLLGVAWTAIRSAVPSSHTRDISPNVPASGDTKKATIHPNSSGLVK